MYLPECPLVGLHTRMIVNAGWASVEEWEPRVLDRLPSTGKILAHFTYCAISIVLEYSRDCDLNSCMGTEIYLAYL